MRKIRNSKSNSNCSRPPRINSSLSNLPLPSLSYQSSRNHHQMAWKHYLPPKFSKSPQKRLPFLRRRNSSLLNCRHSLLNLKQHLAKSPKGKTWFNSSSKHKKFSSNSSSNSRRNFSNSEMKLKRRSSLQLALGLRSRQ